MANGLYGPGPRDQHSPVHQTCYDTNEVASAVDDFGSPRSLAGITPREIWCVRHGSGRLHRWPHPREAQRFSRDLWGEIVRSKVGVFGVDALGVTLKCLSALPDGVVGIFPPR